MKVSGINKNIFGFRSTRSVSALKYNISELSFKEILKSAGLSNEKPFPQFYDRPIQNDFSNYSFRLNLLFLICICIYGVFI